MLTVLDPIIYTDNALYGKLGMEIVAECPKTHLATIIKMPMQLVNVSLRQGNRMTIVGALACIEMDYRCNGIYSTKIPDDINEKIIQTAVKLLKKDLPMRSKVVQRLYSKAIISINIDL